MRLYNAVWHLRDDGDADASYRACALDGSVSGVFHRSHKA